MRADDDPEKQKMKGQTEVKHNILEKYLQPWLLKITEIDQEIRYVDGFAGWGRYDDDSPGSPIIAMDVARGIIDDDYGRIATKLDFFFCDFIEANDANFADLKSEVDAAREDCPRQIKPRCIHSEFEDYARDYIDKKSNNSQPAFFFIDPFGFKGLPFDVVNQLLNLRSTGMEVFITFTSGEMARFLSSDDHEIAISEILGTDRWEDEIEPELEKEEAAQELVRIYEEQLRNEAEVEYVWPFRMSRANKRETVYHLVHATNHFDGFKLMKDIMYREGADDKFAYLGPDHYPYIDQQQDLGSFGGEDKEEQRIQELSNWLHERFQDRTDPISLWDMMEETYEETTLIEPHYRSAGKLLSQQGKADIINHQDKPNGTKTGFGTDDEIKFYRGTLADFT